MVSVTVKAFWLTHELSLTALNFISFVETISDPSARSSIDPLSLYQMAFLWLIKHSKDREKSIWDLTSAFMIIGTVFSPFSFSFSCYACISVHLSYSIFSAMLHSPDPVSPPLTIFSNCNIINWVISLGCCYVFLMDFRDFSLMTVHSWAWQTPLSPYWNKFDYARIAVVAVCVCLPASVCVRVYVYVYLHYLHLSPQHWQPHPHCQTNATKLCCLSILHNDLFTNTKKTT